MTWGSAWRYKFDLIAWSYDYDIEIKIVQRLWVFWFGQIYWFYDHLKQNYHIGIRPLYIIIGNTVNDKDLAVSSDHAWWWLGHGHPFNLVDCQYWVCPGWWQLTGYWLMLVKEVFIYSWTMQPRDLSHSAFCLHYKCVHITPIPIGPYPSNAAATKFC